MRDWLQREWYRTGPAQLLLWPLSMIFLLLTSLRRTLYRTGLLHAGRLPVPVIVVGNITVGGTGKTPLTLWIVEFLRHQGFKPAVISRGYGGTVQQPTSVSAVSDPFMVGDEPVLMSRRAGCPVWVGRDRYRTGRALLKARPDCDVVICDDGLQHYGLARDVEIIVVDAERRFGNGFLLPAGPLREPLRRLADADVLISHGVDAVPGSLPMHLRGALFRNLLNRSLAAEAGQLKGPLTAVAGVGNPRRFFDALQQLGLEFQSKVFPDHHAYRPQELADFSGTVVMTEKDAVKCAAFARPDWWSLEVEAELGEDFGTRLMQAMRK